ncbi:MAG: alpha-mannosidase [Candidatus Helarchaeota archaeon]|nr:alpha-mannosidase [Candidatus Helarchaeota archaeon]
MLDDLLQSHFLDRTLKFLDKRNFFYPGAKIIIKILRTFLWKYKETDYNIYAIGQSHLDAAWLWRRLDTIRKNNVTFSNALKHMDDYPFFKFSCSSPQYFEWMETYFPEKFEKIKQRVKEGRLEIVGGMWIEPDVNCTSGESLVRQRLYGQRYYLEKFGKMSEIGWLSDSFGYTWTLPQILAKSGAKFFYTNKLNWNKETDFPFFLFHWQSPDGSKVLSLNMPYSLNIIVNKPGIGEFKEFTKFLENNQKEHVFNYRSDYEAISKRRTSEYIHDLPFIFGLGDGGGGPLRIEIIYLKDFVRHKQIIGFITMRDYLKKIEKYEDRLPIWNDELYLETHRGTYTSQVWLKVLNRKTEFDLYNLEAISSLTTLFRWQYPAEKLKRMWKLLLFNQFHDILPGSSIPEVYEDTRNDFKKIEQARAQIQRSAIEFLTKKITIPENGLLIINTHSWQRDSLIELNNSQNFITKDRSGNEIPSQIIDNKQIFIAKNIPSIGYTFFSLTNTETLPEYETDLIAHEAENAIRLENSFLKVEINKKSGSISSVYHKHLNKEVLTAPGNKVQIFKERLQISLLPIIEQSNAWNIDPSYNKRLIKLKEEIKVELKESGPVRLLVEVQRRSEKPPILIVQQIILLADTDRIDFKLYLKYHIKSSIVKLTFPLDVDTEKIHCEIPFGVITRSTKPKTPAQKAQWEIPAHKWVDISQEDFGVTLINKSRYGFDAYLHPKYKNLIRMTILRKPLYPRAGDPLESIIPSRRKWHEQSEFSVDYSLYIHKGDWRLAESYLLANEFNNPPTQIPVNKNAGILPEEFEFLRVEPTNVIASALKPPEDMQDQALVIRVFETAGKEADAKIIFSNLISIENGFETDLLELNPQAVKSEQNSLKFKINPFEIKTFLIKYQITNQ